MFNLSNHFCIIRKCQHLACCIIVHVIDAYIKNNKGPNNTDPGFQFETSPLQEPTGRITLYSDSDNRSVDLCLENQPSGANHRDSRPVVSESCGQLQRRRIGFNR